jgi:PAS domain S-box-containing protein
MSNLQDQTFVDALASSKARVCQLEREAIEHKADADEGLVAHLARYRALVLAIGQVIWTQDSNGAMVGEQLSWATYTGQTFAQYQGRGWLDAVHPADRASTVETWTRAIAELKPYEIEHRLRHRDGEYRYFSVRAVPVLADDGSLREWAGIHTDITE